MTYERRPFAKLPASAFEESLLLDGEEVGVCEKRLANLKKGRGRVRRIALKMPDGNQVNLLAVSRESRERLIGVITGRWVQENGFKHGKESCAASSPGSNRMTRKGRSWKRTSPARCRSRPSSRSCARESPRTPRSRKPSWPAGSSTTTSTTRPCSTPCASPAPTQSQSWQPSWRPA
ncbi:MAG: hypothetical protein R6V85_13480 [Polyangia bacterium]